MVWASWISSFKVKTRTDTSDSGSLSQGLQMQRDLRERSHSQSFKHLCVLLVFLEQPKSCSRKFLKSIRFVSFTRNKSSSEVKCACQYSHWRWQCTCLSSLPEFQKRIMYFIELFHNPEQELFQFLHNPHHYWAPSPIHPIPGNQLWTHKTKFKAHNSNANSQQRHVP